MICVPKESHLQPSCKGKEILVHFSCVLGRFHCAHKFNIHGTVHRSMIAITNKMQLSNGILLFHSTLIVQHVSSVMSLIIRNLNCICRF